MIETLVARALGEAQPAPITDPALEQRVRAAVAASGRTIVVLDDDPTGVQTVHDTAVLAGWDVDTLRTELQRPEPLFFILTNSRSLPPDRAAAINREIAGNLLDAGRETNVPFVIASRSDSTLRGNFPAETDALADALGDIDGVLLCPAFFEGGRVTAGHVHFVRDGARLVAAAETDFAQDATFGYRARTLPEWIEEKSGGRIAAGDVAAITLDDIRQGGVDRVAARLRGVSGGQPVVVNALDYPDLWTVVLGLLEAEAAGKRFIYRTGASFVRARAGISARPLLTRDELLGTNAPRPARGLVVVGSHVRRTTEQLERLLEVTGTRGTEVAVAALLESESSRLTEIGRIGGVESEALAAGATPVIFTSRQIERPSGADELDVARTVSGALVAIVRGIAERPDFVIGKGGITSSDVGTRGLDAERAMVFGQIRPGVPVWQLGPESRYSGMPYIVFPGNVGGPETLAEIVVELIGESSAEDCPTPKSVN
ncbi:MAG: hydroxyacid dehydrogenase [Chloroflexota bacterium]|nr:hydroxyacid dehydrogenase [Chloroflexota bacterium]